MAAINLLAMDLVNKIILGVGVLIVILVIGVVVWLWYVRSKYIYDIIILSDRSPHLKRVTDANGNLNLQEDEIRNFKKFRAKGGFFKVQNGWVFKILKPTTAIGKWLGIAKPHAIVPVSNKYIDRIQGYKNSLIFMYQVGVNDYIPLNIYLVDNKNEALIFRTEEDKDMLSYLEVQDLINSTFQFKDMFSKWVVPFGITIMFMAAIILAWIVWKGMAGAAPPASGLIPFTGG